MKTTILLLVISLMACETQIIEPVIKETTDEPISVEKTFKIWNMRIRAENYNEALALSANSFIIITEAIQEYDRIWYLQLYPMNIVAYQYDWKGEIVGAFIKGVYEYFEYEECSFTGKFYSTVIVVDGKFILSYFAQYDHEPNWWMNDTGNNLDPDEFSIKITNE